MILTRKTSRPMPLWYHRIVGARRVRRSLRKHELGIAVGVAMLGGTPAEGTLLPWQIEALRRFGFMQPAVSEPELEEQLLADVEKRGPIRGAHADLLFIDEPFFHYTVFDEAQDLGTKDLPPYLAEAMDRAVERGQIWRLGPHSSQVRRDV